MKRETPIEGKAHYFNDIVEDDTAQKDLDAKPKLL